MITIKEAERIACSVFNIKPKTLYSTRRRSNTWAITMMAGFSYYYLHAAVQDLEDVTPRDHSSMSITIKRFNDWLENDREFRMVFEKFLDQFNDPTIRDYFQIKGRTTFQVFKDRMWEKGLGCEQHHLADYYIPDLKLLIFVSHGQWLQVNHLTGKNYFADMIEKINIAQCSGYKTLVALPDALFTDRMMEYIDKIK